MSTFPNLWAPWRAAYLKGEAPAAAGCLFCRVYALPPEARREHLVLAVNEHGQVMLNRYPYSGGHLMASPARHISSPEELSDAEFDGFSRLWRWALTVLKAEMQPHGVNVGMNLGAAAGAGIAAHLHAHLVPRWAGDVNFMHAVGGVRVISEALLATYDALAPRFAAPLER